MLILHFFGKSSSELSCSSFFQKYLSVKEGLTSNPNVSRAYGCGNAIPEDIEKSQNTKKFKFGQNMVLFKKVCACSFCGRWSFLLRSVKLLILVYFRECLLCIQFNTIQDVCGTHVVKVTSPSGKCQQCRYCYNFASHRAVPVVHMLLKLCPYLGSACNAHFVKVIPPFLAMPTLHIWLEFTPR